MEAPSTPHARALRMRSKVMMLDTTKSTVQASVSGHASISDLIQWQTWFDVLDTPARALVHQI